MEEKELKIYQGSVSFYEIGNHNTNSILFIPGWLNNKNAFGELIDLLADEFHILAPDLPGFGNSTYDKQYTMDAYVEFLNEFIKTKGIEKVNLFGSSMGGGLSLIYSKKYPNKTNKLILKTPYYSERQLKSLLSNNKIRNWGLDLIQTKLLISLAYKIVYSRFKGLNKGVTENNVWFSKMLENTEYIQPATAFKIIQEVLNTNLEQALIENKHQTLVFLSKTDEVLNNIDEIFEKDNYKVEYCTSHSLFNDNTWEISEKIRAFLR